MMPGRRWILGLCVLAGLAVLLAGCAARRSSVIVEWTTETEVDTIGFNLYRSESPDGPYEKVNEELIPAEGDPLVGKRYVFTDTDVIAGRTYYYQLEDVEVTGATNRYGPIVVQARPAWPPWAGPALAGLIVLLAWLGRRWGFGVRWPLARGRRPPSPPSASDDGG